MASRLVRNVFSRRLPAPSLPRILLRRGIAADTGLVFCNPDSRSADLLRRDVLAPCYRQQVARPDIISDEGHDARRTGDQACPQSYSPLVLTMLSSLRRVIGGFAIARLPNAYLLGGMHRAFAPTFTTTAFGRSSLEWFGTRS